MGLISGKIGQGVFAEVAKAFAVDEVKPEMSTRKGLHWGGMDLTVEGDGVPAEGEERPFCLSAVDSILFPSFLKRLGVAASKMSAVQSDGGKGLPEGATLDISGHLLGEWMYGQDTKLVSRENVVENITNRSVRQLPQDSSALKTRQYLMEFGGERFILLKVNREDCVEELGLRAACPRGLVELLDGMDRGLLWHRTEPSKTAVL